MLMMEEEDILSHSSNRWPGEHGLVILEAGVESLAKVPREGISLSLAFRGLTIGPTE